MSAYNKYYKKENQSATNSFGAKLPENKELKPVKSGITETLEQDRLTKAAEKPFKFSENLITNTNAKDKYEFRNTLPDSNPLLWEYNR